MSATSNRDRLKQLFNSALESDPRERPTFLAEACAGDDELRKQVESLLSTYSQHQDFLESPIFELTAAEVAAQVLDADEAPSIIGQHIGPYRLLRELGRGGMGAVYLGARDDGHYDQQVAVKLIKLGMDSEEVLRRFRRERQILANLAHPYISRLLDGGVSTDGRPYFVMEYVDGQAIDEYVRSQQLSTAQRLELFLEVCVAVQYAHRKQIIHRDIKPGNILITADGKPKLLDFGIAKLLDGDQLAPNTTEAAERPLTPDYASPEQLRGLPLTPASDVYALGVVLCELLTGRRPYTLQSRAPEEILQAVLETDPQKPSAIVSSKTSWPSRGNESGGGSLRQLSNYSHDDRLNELRRELRGDLDNIVLMALRKDPEQRYQSVETFAEDIRRHLADQPINAQKPNRIVTTVKFLKRKKSPIALTLALALICLMLGASLAWFKGIKPTRNSLAVLPFANRSDPKMEYISDRLTDNLIASLSRVPRLDVSGHNSVFRFKGQSFDPKTIGATLGVAAVLAGTVTSEGEGVVVEAELFDISSGQRVWSKQYSGRTVDTLSMHQEIALAVSEKLGLKLSDEEKLETEKRYKLLPKE